jgi:hypothetical protein
MPYQNRHKQGTNKIDRTQGDVTQMCLYAGTGVGAVNDLPSAEELVARLWRECQDRSAHS